MHLIAPLVCGVANAGSGSARIVERGSTTPATLYSSFEGDQFASSSIDNDGDVILDAYGRAEVYVNTVCDVTVFDADGTVQVSFTAGYAASAIEVRSNSFSGTDYETGLQGTYSPTTLQEILDLWVATGDGRASNWGLSSQLLPFVVVTDPDFGARGDGTTDDTSAIVAAMAAVSSPGGIVAFPPGDYRVTSILTIPANVSLVGAGQGATAISLDSSSTNLMTFAAGASAFRQTIEGMQLRASQFNNNALIGASANVGFRNCYLGSSMSTGNLFVLGAGVYDFDNCTFELAGATGACITQDPAATCVTNIYDSRFVATTNAFTGDVILGDNLQLHDTSFDMSAVVLGTISCVTFDLGVSTRITGTIIGCTFTGGGGATVTAMTLGAYGNTSRFYENGNRFVSSVTSYSYTASDATAGVRLGSREGSVYTVSDNSASVALPTDQFGTCILTSTHASPVMTGTLPPNGSSGRVFFYHPSGGAGTAQPTTNFFGGGAAVTANTSTHAWEYTCLKVNATLRMMIVVDGRACGNGA